MLGSANSSIATSPSANSSSLANYLGRTAWQAAVSNMTNIAVKSVIKGKNLF